MRDAKRPTAYEGGRHTRNSTVESIVDKVRQCDYIFCYLDGRFPEHNYIFELGIAVALNKRVFIYVQEGTCEDFIDRLPLHSFGARDVLMSASREEACRDFSRILGYSFED